MTENISEIYYEKLGTTTNPARDLTAFYGSIFEREVGRTEIILFNRLLKLYGRFTVFFAVLDMTSMDNVNFDKPFPLLAYFCKKRLESKNGSIMTDLLYLDNEVSKLERQIEKMKGHKLPIARSIDE